MTKQRLAKSIVGACIITGLVLWILSACTSQPLPQEPSVLTPVRKPSHQIASSDLQLREVWRRVIGPIYSIGVGYSSVIANNVIVLPIFGDETRLVAFNTQDGQTLWTQKLTTPQYPHNPDRVDSILVDPKQVYVAVPFVIRSFSLADGQSNWMTEALPGHAGYDIFPLTQEGVIQVYSTLEDRLIYSIDTSNGQINHIEQYSRTLVTIMGPIQYHDGVKSRDNPTSLFGIDSYTGNQLWQSNVKGPVSGWPVFANTETTLIATGFPLKEISAISSTSGQVVWQTHEASVRSSFVVVDGSVYFLTPDAALVAQDVLTGHPKGQLQFSNGPLSATDASQYFVFAGQAMLFVYFGDSQELIAFVTD